MNNLHGLKLIDYAGMKMIVDMGDPSFEREDEVLRVSQDLQILAVVLNDDMDIEPSYRRDLEASGIRVMTASEYAMKGYTDGRS